MTALTIDDQMAVCLDMQRAIIGLTSDGVEINDPRFPYRIVSSVVKDESNVLAFDTLQLYRRDSAYSARALKRIINRLPLLDIMLTTAAMQLGSDYPNEAYYRSMAASGRAPRTLLSIAAWATTINRPGGASAAIAEMYSVSQRTAFRWLSHARATIPASSAYANEDH